MSGLVQLFITPTGTHYFVSFRHDMHANVINQTGTIDIYVDGYSVKSSVIEVHQGKVGQALIYLGNCVPGNTYEVAVYWNVGTNLYSYYPELVVLDLP